MTGNLTRSPHLAARMGQWSAGHWKTATFGWLFFVIAAVALGSVAGTRTADPNAPGPGESGRMERILDDGFAQPAQETVLVQTHGTVTVDDPAVRTAIAEITADLASLAAVQNVQPPDLADGAPGVSADRSSAVITFEIRGSAETAADRIDPVIDAVDAAQQRHPDLYVGLFGDASAVAAIDAAYADDLGKAGLLSLPITLGILILAFGALVAAGLPLLLALTAVFGTFGLMALPSHVLPQAMQAPALVLLVGLAVGVDYSMFYLKRERQERAAGRSPADALSIAAATSGRSVLISGLTVMAAMAGMFLTGDATFASLGVAAILVVAVAVLGSLTVLPALLSRLGDRVDRLRLPLLGRRRHGHTSRVWGRVVDLALRRPLVSAILAGGLLVALATPALQLRMASPGPDTFPPSLPAVQTYQRLQVAFPGTALPAQVVVRAPDVSSPEMKAAIDRLEQRALASGLMYDPITVQANDSATVAAISVPISGDGTDQQSYRSLEALREIVPETVGSLPGTEAGVTGLTASWKDQADELRSNLPPVVTFVLLLAFGLMLVAFRSVVVAAKAVLLNLLSVVAAYGVLVLVFQHGIGRQLLGFHNTDGIDPVVPLLLFVILFGLSMDYHVFILSRVRELFDRGASMDEAVAEGIKRTAGVVTSAAVVMVCVFSIFGALSMLFFKQFGVGLAAAILLDATVVRAVLLPATMRLLGEWNWYLPRWLDWLPAPAHSELPVPEVPRNRAQAAVR